MTTPASALSEVFAQDSLATRGGYELRVSLPSGEKLSVTATGSEPVARSTSGNIYNLICGFKPFAITSALATLESAGGLDLAAPVEWCPPSTATLHDLLTHTAGLEDPDALSYLSRSEAGRAHLRRAVKLRPLQRGDRPKFSEVGVLVVLDELLRERCCMSLVDAEDRLASAMGFTSTFGRRAGVAVEGVGTLLEITKNGRVIPFLHDRQSSFLDCESVTFLGGYSTVHEMAHFYAGLSALSGGLGVSGLPSASLWGSAMSFGGSPFTCGLMVPRHHEIASAPSDCLGQIGFMRSTLGFAVPGGISGFGVIRCIDFTSLDRLLQIWNRVVQRCLTL